MRLQAPRAPKSAAMMSVATTLRSVGVPLRMHMGSLWQNQVARPLSSAIHADLLVGTKGPAQRAKRQTHDEVLHYLGNLFNLEDRVAFISGGAGAVGIPLAISLAKFSKPPPNQFSSSAAPDDCGALAGVVLTSWWLTYQSAGPNSISWYTRSRSWADRRLQ